MIRESQARRTSGYTNAARPDRRGAGQPRRDDRLVDDGILAGAIAAGLLTIAFAIGFAGFTVVNPKTAKVFSCSATTGARSRRPDSAGSIRSPRGGSCRSRSATSRAAS